MHNNSSRLLYRAACRRPQGPDNSASACAAYELVAERIRQRDPSRLLTWASRYGAGAVCDRHADVVARNVCASASWQVSALAMTRSGYRQPRVHDS